MTDINKKNFFSFFFLDDTACLSSTLVSEIHRLGRSQKARPGCWERRRYERAQKMCLCAVIGQTTGSYIVVRHHTFFSLFFKALNEEKKMFLMQTMLANLLVLDVRNGEILGGHLGREKEST